MSPVEIPFVAPAADSTPALALNATGHWTEAQHQESMALIGGAWELLPPVLSDEETNCVVVITPDFALTLHTTMCQREAVCTNVRGQTAAR